MKAIASLALLKTNWDNNKRDYIENFVPFIVTLISRKKYKSIDVDIICKDFSEEFGLRIPYHPMITILNRTKKRGFIKKELKNYVPIREKFIDDDFSDVAKEQERKYQTLINRFIKFCRTQYENLSMK